MKINKMIENVGSNESSSIHLVSTCSKVYPLYIFCTSMSIRGHRVTKLVFAGCQNELVTVDFHENFLYLLKSITWVELVSVHDAHCPSKTNYETFFISGLKYLDTHFCSGG